MAQPVTIIQVDGNQDVPTNSFTEYNLGTEVVASKPDSAYWGLSETGNEYVKLQPAKFYLITVTAIWDVQSAGNRELAAVCHYEFTDPASNFDATFRLQTLPGAAGSYVEMSAAQIIPTANILNGSVTNIKLNVRAWQNSGHTVALIPGTALTVLELDA